MRTPASFAAMTVLASATIPALAATAVPVSEPASSGITVGRDIEWRDGHAAFYANTEADVHGRHREMHAWMNDALADWRRGAAAAQGTPAYEHSLRALRQWLQAYHREWHRAYLAGGFAAVDRLERRIAAQWSPYGNPVADLLEMEAQGMDSLEASAKWFSTLGGRPSTYDPSKRMSRRAIVDQTEARNALWESQATIRFLRPEPAPWSVR